MSGFTIPNTPEAPASQNQAEPDSLDFQILGKQNSGVVSGCAVTPGSSTSVDVASGEILVNGVYYPVASATSLSLSAYDTLAFFDVIVARVSGSSATAVVVKGTEDNNPRFPQVGTGGGQINLNTDVVLATVWRDGALVDTNRIIDKRIFVRTTTSRTGSSATGGTSADTFVNTSWSPGTNLASPLSVKVGSTWYNLAYWPSSGNFSAGTITANLNGNATTATTASSVAWSGITGVPAIVYNNGGTYSINITGNAGSASSVAWSNVSGKPAIVYNDGGTYSINITGSSSTSGYLSAIVNVDPLGGPYIGWSNGNGRWAIDGDIQVYRAYISYINSYGPVTGAGTAVIRESSGNLRVSSSLRELKNNIQDLDDGLSVINALRPRTFKWNIKDEDSEFEQGLKNDYFERGFIVEEILEVDENLVHFIPGNENNRSPIMWKTNDVISLLVKSVQELSSRLEALEAQLG